MMKRRKRTYKIIIATIVLTSVFLSARYIYKKYNAKWEIVSQVYMNDFNGDGKKQEMLLIYRPCDDSPCDTVSAMRLIDVESKKTLWKSNLIYSEISGDKRIGFKDSIFAIAYHGRYGSSYENKRGAEGFNCKTGEKIWECSLGQASSYDHKNCMIQNENNLFALVQTAEDTLQITSINITNGKKNWDAYINSRYFFKAAPYFTSDKLIISSDRNVCIIDTNTGETSDITMGKDYEAIFQYDKNTHLIVKQNSIVKYDTSAVLIKEFSQDENNMLKDVNMISVYKDRLVYIKRQDKNSLIGTVNIFSDNEGEDYVFKDDLYRESYNTWLTKNKDREISGFDRINDRFIPLIFKKYEENKDVNKLVIFDLDSNTVFQESELFYTPSFAFSFRDVFYYNGYYVITAFEDMPDRQNNEWIITISGKTGKLYSAVRLISKEGYNLPILIWPGFEMFADNYFYASENGKSWCLSFPGLELVYTNNTSLEVTDAKDEIDQLFGKIIRENE